MARLDARNLLRHPESLGSDSRDKACMMQPTWQLLFEPLTHSGTNHLLELERGVERALPKAVLMILFPACEIGKRYEQHCVAQHLFYK
jgi:hypothetical protein